MTSLVAISSRSRINSNFLLYLSWISLYIYYSRLGMNPKPNLKSPLPSLQNWTSFTEWTRDKILMKGAKVSCAKIRHTDYVLCISKEMRYIDYMGALQGSDTLWIVTCEAAPAKYFQLFKKCFCIKLFWRLNLQFKLVFLGWIYLSTIVHRPCLVREIFLILVL